MKKLCLGLALGLVAGYLISDMPQIKKLIEKGKEKMAKVEKD